MGRIIQNGVIKRNEMIPIGTTWGTIQLYYNSAKLLVNFHQSERCRMKGFFVVVVEEVRKLTTNQKGLSEKHKHANN